MATGIPPEGSIAPATREVLRRQRNARVLTGDVTRIDLADRTVTSVMPGKVTITPYDSLIVAAGAGQSYFGHDDFAEHAHSVKTIDDALALRGCLFGAFELAEVETDPAVIERWQTFVVVGGGPTGVEIAGQIAELTRRTPPGEFRNIDPARSRVILFEAGPKVLAGFGGRLSDRASRELRRVGVELRVNTKIVGVDETGVDVVAADGTRSRVEAIPQRHARPPRFVGVPRSATTAVNLVFESTGESLAHSRVRSILTSASSSTVRLREEQARRSC